MKRLDHSPTIHRSALVTASGFGRYNEVAEGARLNEVEMGDYSYCDRFADIFCATIGKFANIAAMSRINAGNHPVERASLHHFMYRSRMYWPDREDEAAFFDWRRDHRVHIGHDTWIGHGAIVLPGRRVGTGAVVGAGSVVTKDVAPYQIVAGTPAEPIRMRHPRAIADRLMTLAWWDWDHDRLGAALDDFRALSAEAFLERYGA